MVIQRAAVSDGLQEFTDAEHLLFHKIVLGVHFSDNFVDDMFNIPSKGVRGPVSEWASIEDGFRVFLVLLRGVTLVFRLGNIDSAWNGVFLLFGVVAQRGH